MMFGYATNETPELMPLSIAMAHRLARRLADVRKSGEMPYLRPDGKTQVTVEYENGFPRRLDAIVVSTQHHPKVKLADIREGVINKVIKEVVPPELMDKNTRIFVNPTGRFVIGGPRGMRVLPAGRLLWIHMVVWPGTVEVLFRARTPPRLTGRPAMLPAM